MLIKVLKTFFITVGIIIFASILFTVGAIAGYTISQNNIQPQIVEKPVFIEQKEAQRYIDENSPLDVYQTLLTESQKNFTFELQVAAGVNYEKDKNFILVNLENEYSRLSARYNTEIEKPIRIILIDDIQAYEKDLNFHYEGDQNFAAFSKGDDYIEIFFNIKYTIDKFYMSHTLSHELVHIFQYHQNNFIFSDTPIWYYEGMAENLAYPTEKPLIHNEIYQTIPNLEILKQKISSSKSVDYAVGYDTAGQFYDYLIQKYGEANILKLMKDFYPKTFDSYFTQLTNYSPDEVYIDWTQSL
jgi:hypothetical protein